MGVLLLVKLFALEPGAGGAVAGPVDRSAMPSRSGPAL
jgi:hypothetical protein